MWLNESSEDKRVHGQGSLTQVTSLPRPYFYFANLVKKKIIIIIIYTHTHTHTHINK